MAQIVQLLLLYSRDDSTRNQETGEENREKMEVDIDEMETENEESKTSSDLFSCQTDEEWILCLLRKCEDLVGITRTNTTPSNLLSYIKNSW